LIGWLGRQPTDRQLLFGEEPPANRRDTRFMDN